MSFTIKLLKDAGGPRVIVDRRLWVTADGSRAVEDGDPAAAFLLCAPGKPVPRAELERLGVKIESFDQEKVGKGLGRRRRRRGVKRDKAPTEDKAQPAADNKGGAGVPGTAKAASKTIAMADAGDLAVLEELEADREDGPRAGVTKALAKRRAELEE